MSRSSARRSRGAETRLRVLGLRVQGYSVRRIAAELDLSSSTVFEHLNRALAELAAETLERTEELRALELERLDAATAAIWDSVLDGDHGAIQTFLRLSERRARLFGLDVQRPGAAEGDAPALHLAALVQRALENRAQRLAAEMTEEELGTEYRRLRDGVPPALE